MKQQLTFADTLFRFNPQELSKAYSIVIS